MALTWVLVVPTFAFAQASITVVVKDTTGAVLPGVTVEASSPVLARLFAVCTQQVHQQVDF